MSAGHKQAVSGGGHRSAPAALGRGIPAVFLDRDGAISEEAGYINQISRLQLDPWSATAIVTGN